MSLSKLVGICLGIACVLSTVGCMSDSLYGINEQQLPCAVAWDKLEKDINKSRALKFFSKDLAEVQSEIEAMRTAARNGAVEDRPVTAYNDMVPEIGDWLVKTLPASKAGQGVTKNVLIFKPIRNDITKVDSTRPDDHALEEALSSLNARLLESDVLRANFVFLALNSDVGADALAKLREGKPVALVDSPTGGGVVTKQYPLEQCYKITGDITQLFDRSRGSLRIIMHTRVCHPVTDQDLHAKTTVREYRYQPYQKHWLTVDEDKALQVTFDAAAAAHAKK